MQRNNHLRNQLASTLNPDSMYHLSFKPNAQQNPRIQYEEKSNQGVMKLKTQPATQEKGKFLSLVSKPKKNLKRGKNNKKTLLKKSHSVILGGTKKSINTTNQTEQSLKSSRCKSCTNFNQTHQNSTLITQSTQIQSVNNVFIQRNIPMNLITQSNDNNSQLTKIISHKLKLDTIQQPHQFFTQKLALNTGGQKNYETGRLDRRLLLRSNVNSGSMGRVYFSVGGQKKEVQVKERNEGLNLKIERPFLTPRFDKSQQNNQRKRRQRAGFIRSASARKVSSPNNKGVQRIQPYTASKFSSVQQQSYSKRNDCKAQPSVKQQQIDQCISKMSLIRKQIDEIQSMIHSRLQTSQLRTKLLYGSQTERVVKQEVQQGDNLYQCKMLTHRDVITSNNNINISNSINKNNNNRQRLAQSRSSETIVDDLNGLSRSLSMSRCALMQSSQQKININNNISNITNGSRSILIQKQQPIKQQQLKYQYLTNNNTQHHNILNLSEICTLIKYPNGNNNLLSQQFIDKQYIGQFTTPKSINNNHNINNNNNKSTNYNNKNNKQYNQQNNLINNYNIINTPYTINSSLINRIR